MLQTACFDLGNVLLFFDHNKMFTQIGDISGLSPAQVKALATPAIQEAYEQGSLTSQELYRHFQTEAPHPFTFDAFMHAMADIFTPNTPLWPTLHRLKQKGLQLILISNTCESHYLFAKKTYPILSLFDHTLLSYEIGFMKPHPPIYEKALKLAKKNVFFTDDLLVNVEGARKVGLDSEVYEDVPSLQRHLQNRGCHFLK